MDNQLLLDAIGQMLDEKLEPINQRLDKLEQGQAKLEQGQAGIEQRIERVEDEIGNLINGQTEIKATVNSLHESVIRIETEYPKKIQAAFDGSLLANELLGDIRPRVAVLEDVTGTHSVELIRLAHKIDSQG